MIAFSYGRLSDKRQEQGKSQQRQAQMAREWCERKGITLDETLSFFDSGISGFRGSNRKRGGLGRFMKACENKLVKPGSYLLVESLDRLSRDQLHEGQQLIRDLLFKYKIKIVLLGFASTELTAENYEMTHYLIDAEFVRAHGESKRKSDLSTWNWDDRRKEMAKGKKLTLKVPMWLKVVDGEVVKDDEKAATVRRIFDWAIAGWGFTRIAKQLRLEGEPVFGTGRHWRNCTIEQILHSRAVLGEFQPMKLVNGERVPFGESLRDYFPAVVTADQFTAAKLAIEGRRRRRGGRTSPGVPNLFTGLVYERKFGSPACPWLPDAADESMCYSQKFSVGYLRSSHMDSPGFRYDHFERSMLYWLREVNVRLDNSADVSVLREKRDELDRQIKEMDAAIKGRPKQLGKYLEQVADMTADRDRLTAEMESATVPMQSHLLHSKRLVAALSKSKGEKLEALRLEVRQSLATVIDRITVTVSPQGRHHNTKVTALVRFKDGQIRGVYYTTLEGRVIEGGAMLGVGGIGPKGKKVTMQQHAEEMGEFPVDHNPLDDVKAKCKELREQGRTYEEIMAATGITNRITVWRYATGYVRPSTQ